MEKKRFEYKPKDEFSLSRTLECGQCFRFEKIGEEKYSVVAFSKEIQVEQVDETLIFTGVNDEEFTDIWCDYFDFTGVHDYSSYDKMLCKDERLAKASSYAKGIHILNQEPFETLMSFIISQNNNIPRIKGIIGRFCESFGEKINDNVYDFPKANALKDLSAESYAPLRAGFRVKYLMDAVLNVNNGNVNFEKIKTLDIESAREELMKIKGVGRKVADCTMLYGLGFFEAFPEDVWIKRAMSELFPEGLPSQFNEIGGIAQQYLFHYIRTREE